VGGDKFGDERPGDDVVRLTQDSKGSSSQGASSIQASDGTPTLPGGAEFFVSFMPVTQQGPTSASGNTGSAAPDTHSLQRAGFMEELLTADVKNLVESLQTPKHSETPADWFSNSWLVDAWLNDIVIDAAELNPLGKR
jgi:hypothetical protein